MHSASMRPLGATAPSDRRGQATRRQTSRSGLAPPATLRAMTDLDDVLATIDTLGRGPRRGRGHRSGRRARGPRRARPSLSLGVGDQARDRAGRADRGRPRPDRPRRGGRSAGIDRPPSAGPRVGAPVRGPEPILAAPGTRRIYSNPGFDALGALVGEREGRPFEAVLGDWVLAPLGMDDTTPRGAAVAGPARADRRPRRAGGASSSGRRWSRAATARGGDDGRVSRAGRRACPGVGRFDPCDWGLGLELHDGKTPHWMGDRNSPATFGHFGGSGTFLWVDPVRRPRAGRADRPRVRAVGARGVAAVLGFGARGRRRLSR